MKTYPAWHPVLSHFIVGVVDDDTYYWVCLSSDQPFQVYYKVRQVLLQTATADFIKMCDGLLLQSATAFLLKFDSFYKVRQFYYKVRQNTHA